MSEEFLYLTTTGRVTGSPCGIEIWFVEHEGHFYIVSELRERANWVKNIIGNPEVYFGVGTSDNRECVRKNTRARARVINEAEESDLHKEICALMNTKYGWSNGLVVELAPV